MAGVPKFQAAARPWHPSERAAAHQACSPAGLAPYSSSLQQHPNANRRRLHTENLPFLQTAPCHLFPILQSPEERRQKKIEQKHTRNVSYTFQAIQFQAKQAHKNPGTPTHPDGQPSISSNSPPCSLAANLIITLIYIRNPLTDNAYTPDTRGVEPQKPSCSLTHYKTGSGSSRSPANILPRKRQQ